MVTKCKSLLGTIGLNLGVVVSLIEITKNILLINGNLGNQFYIQGANGVSFGPSYPLILLCFIILLYIYIYIYLLFYYFIILLFIYIYI